MFDFTYLWMYLFIPLPLIVRYFLMPHKRPFTQVWIPLATGLQQGQDTTNQHYFNKLLPWLIWIMLLSALAKPVWYGQPIRLQQKSRNMIVAIDLSGSMHTVDMSLNGQQVDRLTLIKSLLTDFIATRKGDRLGLILFADHAYLQTPLTFDLRTISTMMNKSQLGLVGTQTAIGEAIALADKRFIENKNKQRVLILLTDGANTAGVIPPLKAAEQAAKNHVTIYTIGIGADVMIKHTIFGQQRINPSADLDTATLTKISTLTGGQYFRARDQQDLSNIYKKINKLEHIDAGFLEFRPEKNLFYWPLSGAFILLILSFVNFRVRRRDDLL
ncbi:MAG: VWA domain-containing protein [Psychromonas sp.]|nr:VWA domain-containing protein [Psychromonas sp.]